MKNTTKILKKSKNKAVSSQEVILPRGIVVLDSLMSNEAIKDLRAALPSGTQEVFVINE